MDSPPLKSCNEREKKKPHQLWSSVFPSTKEVAKVTINGKLLITDTYTLLLRE